jgi:co-chaperonin GroES (HSP10)
MRVTGQRVLLEVKPLETVLKSGLILPDIEDGIKKMNPSRKGVVEQLGDADNFEVTVGEEVLYNAKMETKVDETHVLIPQGAILYRYV